jgi:hypothetical protein
MGDRYIISVQCPRCAYVDADIYYAPTCGFTEHTCTQCGEIIDLATYTGISREDASNVGEIAQLVKEIDEGGKA